MNKCEMLRENHGMEVDNCNMCINSDEMQMLYCCKMMMNNCESMMKSMRMGDCCPEMISHQCELMMCSCEMMMKNCEMMMNCPEKSKNCDLMCNCQNMIRNCQIIMNCCEMMMKNCEMMMNCTEKMKNCEMMMNCCEMMAKNCEMMMCNSEQMMKNCNVTMKNQFYLKKLVQLLRLARDLSRISFLILGQLGNCRRQHRILIKGTVSPGGSSAI